MNDQRKGGFDIIVEGSRKGSPGKWAKKTLHIESPWGSGSEQEKFEVLAAIRRQYNPDERGNIRGTEGQTADQVARCEGFSALLYRRAQYPAAHTTIVAPPAGYSRISNTSR